jgi:peptidyl-prolyl cis-trans isomerase SurA
MKKIIIRLLMTGLLLLGGQWAHSEATNRVVAIVNDEIITFYELEKVKKNYNLPEMEKEKEEEFQKQLLFQLIDQKLIDLQIRRLGIQIAGEEVDKAVDRIKQDQGLKSPEDFSKALLREGLSESEFRKKVKDQILRFKLISREIGSKIIIPESQMLEYFEKNKSKFQTVEGVQMAHIFLPMSDKTPPEERDNLKKKIEEIQDRLIKGEDFAELARKFSQDSSASQGGNLGTFAIEDIDPSLRKVIFTLKPGEFSSILQSPNGWQIVKLIEFKGGKEVSYSEAKNRVQDQLFQEEVDKRFTQWLQKVKDRSYIQILL